MKARTSIVTICGDPGGAAALAPVLRKLQQDSTIALNNFAYLHAPTILEHAGIPSRTLSSGDVSQSRALLDELGASLLLTATSSNALNLEKHFVVAARQTRRPSIGVLDFWSNYADRFRDADGGLSATPDTLAIMDEKARTGLREAGVRAKLVVTGQPAFDTLAERRRTFTNADRDAARLAMGAEPSDCLVLFVSQAFDDLHGDAQARIGFDQHHVRRLVIDTLKSIPSPRAVLAIRKHPRDAAIPLEHHSGLRITHDLTPDRWHAVMAADLIVGMNSVLLLEATYLGGAVLSLQPGLIGDDTLPSNASGTSASAYLPDSAARLLEDYVRDPELRMRLRERASGSAPHGNATNRVCECIHQHLSRKPAARISA